MEEKQMYYYAQINEENVCVATQETSDKAPFENMIQLSSEEEMFTVLGKKYENGTWVTLAPEILPDPEPTESELIQAELLLNQVEMLNRQTEMDETLAAILLNQIGA